MEIYNYTEIKETLMMNVSDFKSESDTEVLLKCFRENGVKSFEKFNGMFSFSIDKEKKKVYLARDRFGVKPLYYFK